MGASPSRGLSRSDLAALVACLAVVAATAATLYAMGRLPICRCGHVALWHGTVASAENSQHLTDPYTFTHVIHGFLFFGAVWLIGRVRGAPLGVWPGLALATVVECAWEIAENTPQVIAHYRAKTVSLGYEGDSIVNSLGDVVAMMVGYAAAATLPVTLIVLVALVIEGMLAWLIRDNLTLNVLMLLHPLESIKAWQTRS